MLLNRSSCSRALHIECHYSRFESMGVPVLKVQQWLWELSRVGSSEFSVSPQSSEVTSGMSVVLGKANCRAKNCISYFPCPQVVCVFYLLRVKAKVLENLEDLKKS